jgi:DNA-binding response OmpR family regulator
MTNLKGLKVLLVDDDEDLRDIIAEHFENAGAIVEKAISGKDGWKKTQIFEPDIVVSDMRMPDGDGLFFANCVRCSAMSQKPVFIVYSGFSDVSASECQKEEIAATLIKPLRSRELIAQVYEIYAQKKVS